MRIVLQGSIGQSGTGGQAWASLQYLIGLRELGHDVYYVEDCGESSLVYQWETSDWTVDIQYPSDCVARCLEPFGFRNRWIYRTDTESRGLGIRDFERICRGADLFIMRAIVPAAWRSEYEATCRRIYIDVDPGFTQVNLLNEDKVLTPALDRCHHLFTVGQRVGASDCEVPTAGRTWHPTLPPVVLSEWPVTATEYQTPFTSVIRLGGEEKTYGSLRLGMRDEQFRALLDLPHLTSQPLLLAVTSPVDPLLELHGWQVVLGEVVTRTCESYRQFIQHSRAELSTAKHGYVATRSGWFSDRSVCYLASGRPVLAEDTGLSDWLPTGQGVVTYTNAIEARDGISRINAEYERHCLAARRLAEEMFAAHRVLPQLLDTAMD